MKFNFPKQQTMGLGRRGVLLTGMALPLVAAFGSAARAEIPRLPQLVFPAPKVKSLGGVYLVAGATVADRVVVAGEQGIIFYSDNGGGNWHQAAVPVSSTITSIAFATPRTGWAAGGLGVILKTEDGGATWTKQLDGVAAIQLMIAATKALVASKPPDDPMAMHAQRRCNILTQEGPGKPFLTILPISEDEVIVFGAFRMAVRTTDGGKTWTDWSFHIDEPVAYNIYDAVAIGPNYYLAVETGLVFCSTDQGQTFTNLANPAPGTLFGICDSGGGNMLTYGVAGEIFVSSDQGNSWNASSLQLTANLNTAIVLSSGALLLGDAGGGLHISSDHGRSFSTLYQNPIITINDIVQTAPENVLLLTDVGILPFDLSTVSLN
jgi:photosystem II stability/assembly factor-like uncharacterized protein